MKSSSPLPEICQTSLLKAMKPQLFKALSDPTRIAIVATLATKAGPSSVSDIAEGCGIDFSGVSRHLKILKEAGLLSADKNGRHVQYRLKSEDLVAILEGYAGAIRLCQSQAE